MCLHTKHQGSRPYGFFFVCLFDLILYVPSTIFQLKRDGSSWDEPVLSLDKCDLLEGPQRSDASEARTRSLSVSSQALYHLASAPWFQPYGFRQEDFFHGFPYTRLCKTCDPWRGPILATGI